MNKKTTLILAIILGVTAVVSIVSAFVTASAISMAHFYGLPYYLLSELIKLIGQGNTFKNIIGWILLAVFGLAPAVYPTINVIKEKKISTISIHWFVFTVIHFLALYFYINPQEILPEEFFINKDLLEVAKTGIAITTYIFIITILVCKSHFDINKDENKATTYALVIAFIIAIVSVFSGLYVGLRNAVNQINSVKGLEDSASIVTLRIIEFIIYIAPYVFGVIASFKLISVIEEFNKNCFGDELEKKIESLSKYVFLLILLVLGSTFLTNVLEFISSRVTLSVHSNININLPLILSAFLLECILSFLRKAISIKKENDLTI
ncbi:MAG: hypothetical protein MJZ37_04675 [Bacilli bacterium]|nr:hypothetical protein [Bacilli bacterium]